MSRKVTIAITVGDINGIGPEVVLKALSNPSIRRRCRPIIIGPGSVMGRYADLLGCEFRLRCEPALAESPSAEEEIEVVDRWQDRDITFEPGKMSAASGQIAGEALELASEWALAGEVAAVVTAPVSKFALNAGGYHYPGQTEFFATRAGTRDFVMVLLSGNFRVGLVTTHCAISKVPALITTERVLNKLQILERDLKARFGIGTPRIAVAALNPHAGEDGLLGREEQEIIRPAIEQARSLGLAVEGPFPADTLFARAEYKDFDAYLAMYHDQGLIPLKMRFFGRAVNYSAGLPIIRTSPDHGTAFDIAGQGLADATSMMEAINLAISLVSKSRGS